MLDDFVLTAVVEEGLLEPEQVERARRLASDQHAPVTDVIVSEGMVSERDLSILRAATCECCYVDLSDFDVDVRNATLLPRSLSSRHQVFPLFVLDGCATVGMADPLDLEAVDQVRSVLKTDVEPVLCEPGALTALIDRAYSLTGGEAESGQSAAGETLSLTTGNEPIVAAVNQILNQAIEENASDIHIGPDERELHLRFRIDGTLQRRHGPTLASHPAIVQRLKVMAHLDLTQTRRPQDGKFRIAHHGQSIDIRLSIIPTVHGENVVMRLLTGAASLAGFEDLGFPEPIGRAFEQVIAQPNGMVLVTGPTGSGKTTTLYTALNRLNTVDRNIITIEDPVEIRLPLVRQVQVNAEIGMTFAGALRSILRQDPDVILVGEIRDDETARIAVQSALTGHLVLSTLHTNDAPGAIARLRDFRCPAFAINSSLLCVIAQRLVKRVCQECARPYEPEVEILAQFGLDPGHDRFVKGGGCPTCMSSGYHGRIGVFEMVRLTRPIRELIERGASIALIREAAGDDGAQAMWHDGLEKARLGVTTLDEVLRVAAIRLDEMPGADEPNEALRFSA